MKKYTFGYIVNDKGKFTNEVLSKVMKDMQEYDKSKPYTAFAASCSDEFGRLEKIESILGRDLLVEEKLVEIENALSEILD